MTSESARKPVHFIASSLKDLHALPDPVRGVFGRLLLDVQYGEMPYGAKPLKGFGGASVLELIEDYDTNTYRAIYTVRLAGAVYVLHVFQKKSRKAIATSKADLDLVRSRYELARQHHAQHYPVASRTEKHDA